MIVQSIKMALKAIIANKMRSFLTMLGIIIGVFSLVVLVSLVDGATSFVTNSISSLGGDYVEISVSNDKGNPLTDFDLDEIENFEEVKELAPDITSPATFVGNGKEKKGSLIGISSPFFRIEKHTLLYGRGISISDVENHVNVAVITYETANNLYGKVNVVGQTINVDGVDFDIVGILEKQEGTFLGMIMGDQPIVYIPITCYTRMPETKFTGYNAMIISITPGVTPEDAKAKLAQFFNQRFDNDKDAYSISSQEEVSSVLGNVTTIMGIVFGGIAAISLLVGGIGIMNIMLVSVTERTKEIGIRKAIGASTNSILLQFIIEAFVISLTGCLIGVLFSYGFIALANQVVKLADFEVSFHVPFSIVLVSAAFSLLVGLVFGLYPANKAARKKPIEALRYDG